MNILITGAGALAIVGVVGLAVAEPTTIDESEASLTPQTPKKWEFLVPDEEWFSINGPIFVGTHEFATEADGENKILVATTSGSRPKAGVNASGEILKLKAENEDGSPFIYAIRVRGAEAGGFEWSPAGVRTGTVEGTKVAVIDRNGNGVFGEVGLDAICVGNRLGAALSSKVLRLGDDLFEYGISDDGSKLTYRPFEGETGKLDVVSEFSLKASLDAAVFTSTSGEYSFDLSDSSKGGADVPLGTYQLTYGHVTKGSGSADIARGRMPNVVVGPTGAVVEWGAEVEGEPIVRRTTDEVTITPQYRLFGRGGEEYVAFLPDPSPQRFEITDPETDKRLKKGSLPTG
ncbi:MAG: hypothetical protein R3F34_18940 [Planctomycetota bacterium]